MKAEQENEMCRKIDEAIGVSYIYKDTKEIMAAYTLPRQIKEVIIDIYQNLKKERITKGVNGEFDKQSVYWRLQVLGLSIGRIVKENTEEGAFQDIIGAGIEILMDKFSYTPEKIVDSISAEREQQNQRHQVNINYTNEVWYALMMEEFGEACQAFNDGHIKGFERELIQTLAIVIRYVEFWNYFTYSKKITLTGDDI